jgi:DNA-directed RNA polymerase specialized sigma24 family protein
MKRPASTTNLLAASRQGDLAAWRQLLQRWLPSVAAYLGARLRRIDVIDDLLISTAKEAWCHLDPSLTAEDFPRWLRKMGATVALRWHRRHPTEALSAPLPPELLAAAGEHVTQLVRLDQAIAQLEPLQRMTIEQRFRGQLNGPELADVLHCQADQLQPLLQQALQSLATRLASDPPEPADS